MAELQEIASSGSWPADRWPGTVIRAFEIAFSGDCPTISDVARRLSHEHYRDVDAHLSGMLIKEQLQRTMIAARTG